MNGKADLDGKRRRMIPMVVSGGKTYFQLSFRLAIDALGINPEEVRLVPNRYVRLSEDLKVPLDDEGCFSVTYAGKWGEDFKHYLGRNIIFPPLLIRTPITLGSAKYDHCIGCNANGIAAFNWVPQQISGDKDIRIVGK